ncbi:MAG: carboxyl transferase domain-containing protein [Polyangiaceae bacterium]
MSDAPAQARELEELAKREAARLEPGGPARTARHHRLGRMTGRERVLALVDAGTFEEFGADVLHRHSHASEMLAANREPGDGLVCGIGEVDGRRVAILAHEPTILRGALGHAASRKACKVLDIAESERLPVVTLADCDGVRVEESTDAIEAYGEILTRIIRLRGKVPQLTAAMGLCVGAAAYAAALNDWVCMVASQSYMFITGPKVTKVVTGETVTLEDLGGAAMHSTMTGQCHASVDTENDALAWVRRTLSFLGPAASSDPLDRDTSALTSIVPTNERRAYDMKKVVRELCDTGSLHEVGAAFAKNLLTIFARLSGRPVAIVANQPMVHAGCLDVLASRKGAHFIRYAGAAGIPVITLVDVPGYLPGLKQEQGGILPFGAQLLDAYGSVRVPRVSLVVRKSYGGASVLSFNADIRLGLPTARCGVMGVEAGLEVALGPENPEATAEERKAREARKQDWLREHDHAWAATESGYLDRIIDPRRARSELARALRSLGGNP